MAKTKNRMSEDKILALVDSKVAGCTSYDTKLSKERTKVQSSYDGLTPTKQKEGNSSYVSSDVYDSVESMKAQIVETFAGGHNLIRFNPRGVEDVVEARVATKYVDHVIFDQNCGSEIFQDVIHDGLMGRNSVAQVFWENKIERDENKFSKMPMEELQGLMAQEVEIDADLDEDAPDDAPTYSGTWTRIIDKSRVAIEVIPPEEFYIESRLKNREDGTRGRRRSVTKADLLADGYPKAKIDALGSEGDRHLDLTQDIQARNLTTDDGMANSGEVQSELQYILLHETYTKLALYGDGKAALYRVVHALGVVFEIEEVDEDPFVEFRALRRPHRWWGDNFANRIVPTQNARTVLTRGILDHTAITMNPRWQVLNGAVTNPRELLDGRLGGLVNVKQREAIAPLQYGNLNPFVFETMKMLKENKEENTGISALSQGMSKDAVSSQNSQGLVNDLVTLSQVRQKVVARNFANSFLVPLYLKVYRIVVENEKQERIIELCGEYTPVDPSTWIRQRDVTLSLHLGYGEQEKQAAKLKEAYAGLSQDPAASQFLLPPKRHKLLTDIFEASGIMNHADYLCRPEEVPQPQPDPLRIKELDIEQKKADAAMLNAQAAMAKVQITDDLHKQKMTLDAMMAKIDTMLKQRDADRKDLDVANRVDVSQREITLEENAPPETTKTIVSA